MEEIPARLRQRLSNPRIFALAMRLMETMPHEKNLGVDRLLFSYWEHRRLERHDLRMLDPDGSGFLNALAAHAEHFHKQRLIAVREVGTDLGAEEVVYPDQDLRNRFAGLQRYRDLTHDEISILVGEIRGGQFFLGETARMAPTYRFQSSALGFALGLYLVHEALQVLQKTRKGSELDALREHFAILLEPVMPSIRRPINCSQPSLLPVLN